MNLALIGYGGHGAVVSDIARLNKYKKIYIFDDNIIKIKNKNDIYLGKINAAFKFNDLLFFFLICDIKHRKSIFLILEK